MVVDGIEVMPLTRVGFPWAYMSLDGQLYHTRTNKFYWHVGTPPSEQIRHPHGFHLSSIYGNSSGWITVRDAVAWAWMDEPEEKWKNSRYAAVIARYREFFALAKNGDLRYLCLGSKRHRINYYVSRYGDLWSDKNCYKHKPRIKDDGYLEVKVNGRATSLHRLIAFKFCPIPDDLLAQGYTYRSLQVNHIDGNPQNNRWDNLEWTTGEQNVRDSWKKHPKRQDGKTTYSDELLEKACQEFVKGTPNSKIAKMLPISYSVLEQMRYTRSRPRYIRLLKKYRWADTYRYNGKIYHIDDPLVNTSIDASYLETFQIPETESV